MSTPEAEPLRAAPRRFPSAAERAFAQATAPRPVLIGVPLYRHPELARTVVQSLVDCAADIAEIDGEVVLYNDSPQDAALAEVLTVLAAQAQGSFPCRAEINPENLGFVRTCNRALEEGRRRGMDVLLLNSDTVVFPGALSEMARVSRLDPMTGFVNPRSNNATLATLPYQDRFRHLPPHAAQEAWGALAPRLPEVSYIPTAVGFCMLVRWGVLANFGGFDEIYGAGYNEENDLVMRAGRRGYRAVLANHAFVWHKGSASFGLGAATEARELENRRILRTRYPEYYGLTQAYFHGPEQRAELLLGALIPGRDGRLQVAFDFSSFTPAYNGTFIVGQQLLGAAVLTWSDRYELFVICAEDTFAFHNLGRFKVERRDPHDSRPFAAIFRVGQPYDWGALERLALKAVVFGVFMLDTISVDCVHLASPTTTHVWAYTLEHADFIVASSQLTAAQLRRRFAFGGEVVQAQSLHSMDLADYETPPVAPELAPAPPGFIFVVGNHYWHKDVAATANALAAAYPDRDVVVLTGEDEAARTLAEAPLDEGRYAPESLALAANIVRVPAGKLSDAEAGALYAHAGVVVFPSHYEGFGMPILNALAAHTPVFARPLPTTEEIWSGLGGEPNLHVFATLDELIRVLRTPPTWVAQGASPGRPGDGRRNALDILQAMDAALTRADYKRMVSRLRALQAGHDLAGSLSLRRRRGEPGTPVEFVARGGAEWVERRLTELLSLPGLFRLLRATVRMLRATRRAVTPGER